MVAGCQEHQTARSDDLYHWPWDPGSCALEGYPRGTWCHSWPCYRGRNTLHGILLRRKREASPGSLIVNIIQNRFAFASKIHYLCISGGSVTALLFSCLDFHESPINTETAHNKPHSDFSFASNRDAICVKMQGDLRQMTRQSDRDCKLKTRHFWS